ncbi:hypothetical protein GNF72_17160, partial [Clostridium perfringens]|uniref:PduL/EutD family phosphate acyltransferase n=1 Tax=Clostridium perfringens TaxID=1502 RepID=UPI002AC41D0E
MDGCEAILKLLLEAVQANGANTEVKNDSSEIPVGVSNRHVHLSQRDLNILFGEDYHLAKMKDLSQPGQYACKETLTICGPKGAIEKIRILGPTRSKTQVEVLAGDWNRKEKDPYYYAMFDENGYQIWMGNQSRHGISEELTKIGKT